MGDFNRTESARFAQDNQKVMGELNTGVDKALAEVAGRGFPSAPGDTLATILAAGQSAKDKLVEANGKIYDDRRKVLFEQDEFAMKLIVQLAKLGMELYREELLNALALEAAANIALRDRGNADVMSMVAAIDKKQVNLIRAKAEMESRIIVFKAQLVAAEAATLNYESALIQAQLATAEKKLEIISSIYEVLKAEQLVLAAENRRSFTLEVLLQAQMVVAEIKKTMIPFYLEKAEARKALAEAIKKEIPVQKEIIELGYDRIDLKTTEEYVAHLLRQAEGNLALAQSDAIRADKSTELARAWYKRVQKEFSNNTETAILTKKMDLAQKGILLKLQTSWDRTSPEIENAISLADWEAGATGDEIAYISKGLSERGVLQADAILSGKETRTDTYATTNLTRKISG